MSSMTLRGHSEDDDRDVKLKFEVSSETNLNEYSGRRMTSTKQPRNLYISQLPRTSMLQCALKLHNSLILLQIIQQFPKPTPIPRRHILPPLAILSPQTPQCHKPARHHEVRPRHRLPE